ncbi:hypothetical protein QP391_09660, partial [Lactobacillus paragasseri]
PVCHYQLFSGLVCAVTFTVICATQVRVLGHMVAKPLVGRLDVLAGLLPVLGGEGGSLPAFPTTFLAF